MTATGMRGKLALVTLAVILWLIVPGRLSALDVQGLVDSFDEEFIPVEAIQATATTVFVSYQMSPLADEETLAAHIPYILGRIASAYPEAENIVIGVFIGEESLYEYQVKTEDVAGYASGPMTDEEMLSRITILNYLPTTDFVAESAGLSASFPGGGVWFGTGFIAVVGLLAAGLYLFVWRPAHRRHHARPGRRRSRIDRGHDRVATTRPGPPPWLTLSVEQDLAAPHDVRLAGSILTIGRSSGSDLVLRDGLVSRRHAEIRKVDGGAVLHDLGSTHGTFVNGVRATGSRALRPGDCIRMGNTDVVYQPQAAAGDPERTQKRSGDREGVSRRISLVLDRQVFTIGRSAESDLVLVGRKVSRSHARILQQSGGPAIVDLGSTNGTFVNGVRITGPQRIQPGDIVRIGRTELVVRPGGILGETGMGSALLAVSRGVSAPPALELGGRREVYVGRSRANDVAVRDDAHVSRRHAQIVWTGQGHEIIDLDSTHGLFVNGRRVSRSRLRPGDRIRLGGTDFTYWRDPGDPAGATQRGRRIRRDERKA